MREASLIGVLAGYTAESQALSVFMSATGISG